MVRVYPVKKRQVQDKYDRMVAGKENRVRDLYESTSAVVKFSKRERTDKFRKIRKLMKQISVLEDRKHAMLVAISKYESLRLGLQGVVKTSSENRVSLCERMRNLEAEFEVKRIEKRLVQWKKDMEIS